MGCWLVVATTDPGKLPGHSTWYLLADLPRSTGRRAQAAELAEVVRLYGLRNWVEPGYKQVKASWTGPTSRSPWTGRSNDLGAGLLRVSFFWQELLAEQPAQAATSNSQAAAPAARQKLLDDSDELAFGVPFAEIPQCLGHLMQPIATVDDCSDLPCLAERNQRRQALRAESNGEESELLALGPSQQRPD
jgi:hypothetical protein